MSIYTNLMESRSGFTPADYPSVKLWFPCNETSGTTLTDVVAGVVHNPSQSGYSGSLAFTVDNAVTVTNDASNTTPLQSGSFPELDLSKVILMAAVVRCADATKARIAIGAADGDADHDPAISLSMTTSMHHLFTDSGGNQDGVGTSTDLTLANGSDYIMYIYREGGTPATKAQVLNTDGTQATSATGTNADLLQTDTDNNLVGSTLTPASFTRTSGLHIYCWGVWELDSIPSNLVEGLVFMSDVARQGYKHPFVWFE